MVKGQKGTTPRRRNPRDLREALADVDGLERLHGLQLTLLRGLRRQLRAAIRQIERSTPGAPRVRSSRG